MRVVFDAAIVTGSAVYVRGGANIIA